MHRNSRTVLLFGALALTLTTLAACNEKADVPIAEGYGPNPTLPEPKSSWIPTLNIATANRWPTGEQPTAAEGFSVTALASGLDHPRTLFVLPNGDVLVAETNAPPKPDDGKGIRGWVQKKIMGRAGATTPSANRITLLRDADGDGKAEKRSVFIEGLNSPFGMALVGNDFYVADTDAIMKFTYNEGDLKITTPGVKVADLPGGTINHHWTKDLVASLDGKKLYATVGSNSNVGDNGIEAEKNRAGILEIDIATGSSRVFASGLRNPNGPSWQPQSGALWVAVNERDEIGSDLVPDYMTSVKDGGFYGWPYSYYGQHVDARVSPQRPDLVAKAIVPDYALGPHTASLGLTFYQGDLFPASFQNGAFVGQHGSWNRNPRSGYKVIFVPFKDGMPSGKPQDILTGFLNDKGEARGRPVGVKIDKQGALLVADDVGNTVWRVTPSAKSASR
ncbi:sorbosone dehydrogenase family protein [soil metagenome]